MAEPSTVLLANGVSLTYAEQGAGSQPPVVLVPGPTDSWLSYEPVFGCLPPSIHAVAVSQRGHGDSDKPAHGYKVDDFAADLVLFLDALGTNRAVLVAHSGSCLVVRRVAIDHPGRVAGLVLEASPWTLRGDAALEHFVGSVVSRLRDPIDEDFARSFIADTSSLDMARDVIERMAQELLKVPARVWHEVFDALLLYDDTGELDRILAPTLLIWGDADTLVTLAQQHDLAAAIPTAELVVYPGLGHTPRWDDPARFAADLVTFARRSGLTHR